MAGAGKGGGRKKRRTPTGGAGSGAPGNPHSTGGTDYKGMQGNIGASSGQPAPYGNPQLNDGRQQRLENRNAYLQEDKYADPSDDFSNSAFGEIAQIMASMMQMYQNYQPASISGSSAAKERKRIEQLRTRRPVNQGAFYVGY